MTELNLSINKTAIADQVCNAIKQNILNGVWNTGEKLPSEEKLADMFHVNKLTIRIALQKLNALGIVETKNGSGTFVINFDFPSFIHGVYDFYSEPELLDQVNEYRQTVEIKAAELAIERATVEDLEELKKVYNEYKNSWPELNFPQNENEYMNIAKADINFHRQICNMSHNKLFYYAFVISEKVIYDYVLLVNKRRVEYWKSHGLNQREIAAIKDTHEQIYQSILNRDYANCNKYYMDMINPQKNW